MALVHLLLRLARLGDPFQPHHAALPARLLSGLQHLHVGSSSHVPDSCQELCFARCASCSERRIRGNRRPRIRELEDPCFGLTPQMLITSMYYTRAEQPSRISAWYVWNGVGVAGGGLIGYGIGNIKGSMASWVSVPPHLP